MAINKFQRSRLTFDLSAKVGHIGVPSIYKNIVFSESTMYMKTPCYKLAKIYINCIGHLTKMAARSIYDKKNLKNLLIQNINGFEPHWCNCIVVL